MCRSPKSSNKSIIFCTDEDFFNFRTNVIFFFVISTESCGATKKVRRRHFFSCSDVEKSISTVVGVVVDVAVFVVAVVVVAVSVVS